MASKGKTTSKSVEALPKNSNLPRDEKTFDYRFIILFVLLVGVFVGCLFLNPSREESNNEDVYRTINIDNDDQDIDWNRYQKVDINLNKTLKITKSGTYHLTGTLYDGQISIDAGVSEIKLILDNVAIINQSGPAIVCYNAEDLVIELVGDNTLEDGANYSTDYDEDITGVIYTKSDLVFQGTGQLTISGNHQDAIVGKDDVKFIDGSYNITSVDDAIRGKDSIYVINGDFIINSESDALKSTNELDIGKGFVLIEGGNFSLTSNNAKGIKATNNVLIKNGNFVLDTYDDAIHSNNHVGITDGDINIYTGDDGIHADSKLIVDGGKINITKAYEGLEAQVVTINDGQINIVTTDDGINAGGGADKSSANGPQNDPFKTDENCTLNINGGEIYINTSGDGVDSNGWLYINGGDLTIDGPTNDGNGALDSGLGIVMNSGKIVAIGSKGMAETPGKNSSIHNISVYLDTEYPANTDIKILGQNGEVIVSHVSAKTFSHIAAGDSQFVLGNSYSLYLNNEKIIDFVISDITTTIGNNFYDFDNKK